MEQMINGTEKAALVSKAKVVQKLAVDDHPDPRTPVDTDGDGKPDLVGAKYISGTDDPVSGCPFTHGSAQAKVWWKNLEKLAKTDGHFQGKPLVPGQAGEGQGDFAMLKARLQVYSGYDADTSGKIAANIKNRLYPTTGK